MKLSFGQIDPLMGESFWPKDRLITHILFELCLLRYLVQSTYFRDTLYHMKYLAPKLGTENRFWKTLLIPDIDLSFFD